MTTLHTSIEASISNGPTNSAWFLDVETTSTQQAEIAHMDHRPLRYLNEPKLAFGTS